MAFNPPPAGNPPIEANPPAPPVVRPPPRRLDPRNPADADEVLTRLRKGDPDLDAIRWLREADLDHPAHKEIAAQLDRMVESQRAKGFADHGFFEVFFRWATADNYNTLVRLAQDPDKGAVMARRHKALDTLARLNDPRAAEVIAARLSDGIDRFMALKALETMGPLAQPVLVKHMNDPDLSTRIMVRNVLKKQGASADTLLTQTLADLKNADDRVRDAALDWLSKTPADDKRRGEAAHVLDALITPKRWRVRCSRHWTPGAPRKTAWRSRISSTRRRAHTLAINYGCSAS